MDKRPPEIPAAEGKASRRRSPRFNHEEINLESKKPTRPTPTPVINREKTIKKTNPIGMPCKKVVAMKKLLARTKIEPTEPVADINGLAKRKSAIKNKEEDDHEKTRTTKKKNPVSRPRKNKGIEPTEPIADVNLLAETKRAIKNEEGDYQEKTTATKKKNPVGGPRKNKGR